MEIHEIKSRLCITEVAAHLGLSIDPKTQRACCPFHYDRTPSLQFSRTRQIATCFSPSCSAGTMDVIALTEKMMKVSTHEALRHLTKLAGEAPKKEATAPTKTETQNYHKDHEVMRSSLLASTTARKYLEDRCLDHKTLEIGYNAHKNPRFNYLKGCVTFALRDENGRTVSMYGRSIRANARSKHFYTADRKGLYPKYPPKTTKKLILTESVIDAATLLCVPGITESFTVLALYGTNGLTPEHVHALQQLPDLEEIVLFFDGDAAGRAANGKHGKFLKGPFPEIKVSIVETLEDEDINGIAQAHDAGIFAQLLRERKPFLFSDEKPSDENKKTAGPAKGAELDTSNPDKLTLTTENATYHIMGGIRQGADSLKVTLVTVHPENGRKSRQRLDLYEDRQTARAAKEAAEKLGLDAAALENDMDTLTDLLDAYREAGNAPKAEKKTVTAVKGTRKQQCTDFLKKTGLLRRINELIGRSGVVGEENNRLFLFAIASSYRMPDTLHALIQGSSGSGKTHLLASIMELMPEEDTMSLTRVTESSFYNYGEHELSNKLIGLEDLDGIEEKAELALRELQSRGWIASSTSVKDERSGKIASQVKKVHGPIASLSATTKGGLYEDNMGRCFTIAVDESSEQTLRVVRYQNDRAAGAVDTDRERETKLFLRDCIRLLKPMGAVNPYANRLELPREAHKIRRLNGLFQSFVKQVTLLNQYQRKRDAKGRPIAEKEDLQVAVDIMFESIVLKVDELDGPLRGFYERLKAYIEKKGRESTFVQRDVRHALNISKTQLHRFTVQLEEMEYIAKRGRGPHGATAYAISYWDNNTALRKRIREGLERQLEKL